MIVRNIRYFDSPYSDCYAVDIVVEAQLDILLSSDDWFAHSQHIRCPHYSAGHVEDLQVKFVKLKKFAEILNNFF